MRATLAVILGLLFLCGYLAAVLWAADHVLALHGLAHIAFFAVAGIAWVWPVRRLMFWGAGVGRDIGSASRPGAG